MSSRPALPSAEEIGDLVPIGRIAKQTPYSADFLRQLARVGKLRAYKLHRDWLTTPDAVHEYIKSQTKRHERALSALQAAEKAFLAVALLLVVFSVTPEARAQGLSNPPPAPGAISSTLRNLAADWQAFGNFFGQGLSGVFDATQFAVAEENHQLSGLVSFGQVLLGKTPDEYLADAPAPKSPNHPQGRPLSSRAAVAESHQPEVLGISTIQSNPVSQTDHAMSATPLSRIQDLIDQTLQRYLNNGEFNGPQGPQGSQGPAGVSASSVVNNQNGQTTAVIGGNPIVTYVPPVAQNDFVGTTLFGVGQLSAQDFSTGDANINDNLTVAGSGNLASLNVSGNTSLGNLNVSGPATFSGSVTLPSTTVNTLIPLTNKGDLLTYNGSGVVRFGVGGDGLCLTASSTANSGLAWQNCATASGALISLNGQTQSTQTFASGTEANIALTITSLNGVHTFTPGWIGVLAASRGGIGTTTLGNLTVGSNLSVTGGQSVLIGTSTQITLSSTPTFTTVNGNTIQPGSGTLNLGSNILALTGNANLNQNLLTTSSPTFNSLTLSNPLTAGNGGTGISAAPSNNGQLLIASSNAWTIGSLVPGANVTITTSTPGQITIASTGGSTYLTQNGNGLFNNTGYEVGINSSTPIANLVAEGTSTNPTLPIFAVASSTGQQYLTVTANGNVGIGTTSPSYPLTVLTSSGNPGIALVRGAVVGSYTIGGTGSNGQFPVEIQSNLGDIAFLTNASEKMRITASGNVGIGTTNPTSLFYVQNTSTTSTSGLLNVASSTGASDLFVANNGNVSAPSFNKVFYVDGYPSSGCTVNGTTYTTQLDCAFYTAAAYASSTDSSTLLRLGAGIYNTCAGLNEPTTTAYSFGSPSVSIEGAGASDNNPATTISQSCAINLPTLFKSDNATSTTDTQGLHIMNVSINANLNSPAGLVLFGIDQSSIQNVEVYDATGNPWLGAPTVDGSPLSAYVAIGDPSIVGQGTYEVSINNLKIYAINSESKIAQASVTLSGGSVSAAALLSTCANNGYGSGSSPCAGSGYEWPPQIFLAGHGAGAQACSVMPVLTPNINASGTPGSMSVASINVVSAGSGCSGTIQPTLWDIPPARYGFFNYASDSTYQNIVVQAVGTVAAIYNHVGVTYIHPHTYYQPVGIKDSTANSTYYAPEVDTESAYGFVLSGGKTVINSPTFYWNTAILPNAYGSSGYEITGGNQYRISSEICSNNQNAGDYHEFVGTSGPLDGSTLPPLAQVSGDTPCINNPNPLDTELNNFTIATSTISSGSDYSSPVFSLQGTYWSGSNSGLDDWNFQNILGTGSNPTSTLNIGHTGSSGTVSISASANLYVTGNLGIGTTAPSSVLYVQASSSASTVPLLNVASSSGASYLSVLANGNVGIGSSTPSSTLFVQGSGTTNPFIVASSTGTQLLTVSPAGNLTASNYPNCSGLTTNSNGLIQCTASDERLKQDIIPLGSESGLAAINALNPVSFYWRDPARGTTEQFGLIAQQVQQIFPNLVSTTTATALTPGGALTLNYDGLISPLILATQELSASSTAVQNALQFLQNQVSNLQNSLGGNTSSSELTVYVPSSFSGDSVGEAQIPAGQTSVRVSFSEPYAYQPIVTFSPEGVFMPAFIEEKDAAGFTLALETATTTTITFDWHSFASPTEQLTVNGDTPQPIALVVATSTPDQQQQLTVSLNSGNSSPLAPPDPDSVATSTSDVLGTSTPPSAQNPADSTTTTSTASSSVPSLVAPILTPTPDEGEMAGDSTTTGATVAPTPSPTPSSTTTPTPTTATPTPTPTPVPSPSPAPSPAPIAPPADASTSATAVSASGP